MYTYVPPFFVDFLSTQVTTESSEGVTQGVTQRVGTADAQHLLDLCLKERTKDCGKGSDSVLTLSGRAWALVEDPGDGCSNCPAPRVCLGCDVYMLHEDHRTLWEKEASLGRMALMKNL